jgi:pyruvate/2-oxoglutarate dehydrogenase complex dihydrolipoamide dehydrogenase (E3) component
MEVWHTIKRAGEFGASTPNASLDWSKVVSRMDKIVSKFAGGKKPYLNDLGVDLIMGEAQFASPDSIRVGDKEFTAERFLIGTGSVPFLPPIEGIEHALTSQDMFHIKELPKSLVIIGGGYIGLEFAHIFSNAGVHVTILQRGDRLLKTEDSESSIMIQEISEKRGIKVKINADVKRIEKTNNELTVQFNTDTDSDEVRGEMVLAATGIKPDVEGLGLDAAGIEYSNRGIKVNEFLQTQAERIYAAGDSVGGINITPVAAYEAKVAIRNAFRGNHQKVDYTVVPHSVFTLPPVASVGLTEEVAKDQGIDYDVNRVPFSHNGTAIILGEEEGYAKILTDKVSGRIIGAHIVGAHADEMIHEIAIAMKGKLTLQDLSEVIQVHPTMSEALILLAMEGAKSE